MIHSKDSRFTPFHLLPKIEFMKIKSLKLSHSVSLFSLLLLLLLLCVFVVYRLLSPMLFVHYYGESVCVSLIRYSATGWCWCCRAVSVHCFYVLDFLIRCSFFYCYCCVAWLSLSWLAQWLASRDFSFDSRSIQSLFGCELLRLFVFRSLQHTRHNDFTHTKQQHQQQQQ